MGSHLGTDLEHLGAEPWSGADPGQASVGRVLDGAWGGGTSRASGGHCLGWGWFGVGSSYGAGLGKAKGRIPGLGRSRESGEQDLGVGQF